MLHRRTVKKIMSGGVIPKYMMALLEDRFHNLMAKIVMINRRGKRQCFKYWRRSVFLGSKNRSKIGGEIT